MATKCHMASILLVVLVVLLVAFLTAKLCKKSDATQGQTAKEYGKQPPESWNKKADPQCLGQYRKTGPHGHHYRIYYEPKARRKSLRTNVPHLYL